MTIVAAYLGSAGVFAQTAMLLGTEFQANTFTAASQSEGRLALEANGDFVVVWSNGYPQDGSQAGVFGQRYASSGAKLGAEFQVNILTVGSQAFPAVGADADGDFVVVWQSDGVDGSDIGVAAQRFDSSGTRLASEFRANTFTLNEQSRPTVAREANGDFVVAWQSYGQDGDESGIFARRFASNGTALASEFQVNSYTTSYQYHPAIDLDDDGDFVIVWNSSGQDGYGSGIFGQRFNSLGVPQSPEFRANNVEVGNQHNPDVALDAAGDFTVVWSGPGTQYGMAEEIFARRFASNGVTPGLDLSINEAWSGNQFLPSIGMAPDGAFIVSWDSDDANNRGIFARHFSPSGFPTTGDFQVNTYQTNNQVNSNVGADADGDFVAVWSSASQDGSNYGVFGRRIRVPARIDVDGDGQFMALTDGLLLLRFGFGFTGNTLTNGAVGPNCTRCDSSTILPYLQSLR